MCDFIVTEGLEEAFRATEPELSVLAELLGRPEGDLSFEYRRSPEGGGSVGARPGQLEVILHNRIEAGTGYRVGADAFFVLQPLPHSKVVLSCSSYVYEAVRGKGLGGLLLRWRMEAARCCRDGGEREVYTLIATVRDENETEKNLLLAHGWKRTGPAEPGVSSLWMVNV